jgi:hypothetical protein
MSLEHKIEALTIAVNLLTEKLANINPQPAPVAAPSPHISQPLPVAASAVPFVQSTVAAPASVIPTIPVTLPPAVVAMPAPPVFTPQPAPVVAPAIRPFNDGKTLIDYVMSTYKALGAEKGALIQNVLVGLGYQNINDVNPDHYDALFAGVEKLKV